MLDSSIFLYSIYALKNYTYYNIVGYIFTLRYINIYIMLLKLYYIKNINLTSYHMLLQHSNYVNFPGDITYDIRVST